MTEFMAIAAALAGFVFGLPLLGGWRRLSKAYPAEVALPVASPLAVTPYVGMPWLPVWAGVGANRTGLYIEPAFPASLLLDPVFLPWADVTEAETHLGWHYAELRPRRGTTPIYLVKGSYDEVRSHTGGA